MVKMNNNTILRTAGDDRLTHLPDPLIHQVISHLDMKEMIQTSFLSTKWRYLWRSVPNLKFDDLCKDIEPDVFMGFVNGVLSRNHVDIDEFSVLFYHCEGLDGSHVKLWIIEALRRHVRRLFVDMFLANPIDLHDHIFTSNVETMKLTFLASSMQLPCSMCNATQLKRLKLVGVKFPNGNPNGELIVSWLTMEVVKIEFCDFTHLQTISISAPRLKVFNLRSRNEDDSFKLNISCPNLKLLSWASGGSIDCSPMNIPGIVTANIIVLNRDKLGKEESSRRWIRVLAGISHVRVLTVSTYNLKILTDYPYLWELLPSLHDLRYVVFKYRDLCAYAVVNSHEILQCTYGNIQHGSSSAERDNLEADLSLKGILRYPGRTYSQITDPQLFETELKFLTLLLKRRVILKGMVCGLKDMWVSNQNQLGSISVSFWGDENLVPGRMDGTRFGKLINAPSYARS